MKIPLIKPFINNDIKQRVLQVLDSGFLTEGSVTREFEKLFARYVKSPYAIAVTSCTTGLEIALRALGIGPGDEVIVPDYTYPATASVVAIVGAHCVIVDVDPTNMLIDYDAIEKAVTPRTKAIIPVSLYGNPLDYGRLNQLKQRQNIFLVEDAACSIGAEFDGEKVGSQADITVFSFHPRKFITTGEGGMITTENAEWAQWINSYKHFGMNMNRTNREGVVFEMPGTNYKLSDVLSAIGLGQMKHIDALLTKRRELATNYDRLFTDKPDVRLPEIHPKAKHSYQSYCISVPRRDIIMKVLRPQGVEVQIGTYSLHMHPAFQNKTLFTCRGEMKGSRHAYDTTLALPLFDDLTQEQQEYVVNMILSVLKPD